MNGINETVCGCDAITIFELDGKEYGIKIKNLHAVIRLGTFELVYDNIQGGFPVMQIEDLVIPIIDIHKILGLKKKPGTSKSRIILVDPNDLVFGFEVDNVVEMLTFNPGQGTSGIFTPENCGFTFLAGRLSVGVREISLPDLEKIAANIRSVCGNCYVVNEK